MLRYILRRIVWLIPIILAVSFIIYGLLDLAPGTIIDTLITEQTTPEEMAELRTKYDLDKPMIYRYGKYMLGLARGDLGTSMITGASVFREYLSRFPATLKLSLAALIIGVGLSLPLGIFAAKHAGSIWDNLTTAFTLVGMSMPSFWLGLLLLGWFSMRLKIFPSSDSGGIMSFILPAVTSGLMMTAMVTRQTRSAMLEVLNSDYLRTARAKGVPERQVINRHALKNASIPIITTIGNVLARTLAGAAVVEAVFTWPGIGRLTVDAVAQRDTTLAAGCVVLTSILYVILLLAVDIAYALVDPRIRARYQGGKKKRKAKKEEGSDE
jgi:peptide/nickel transport system permease protein